MAFDLANYVNETMLDNGYPLKNGIAWYTDNCMEDDEVRKMTTVYMECYFNKYATEKVKAAYSNDVKLFIQTELDNLIKEVYDCTILNNLFWGVWALSLLTPDIYTKQGIFNYDFALSRVEMNNHIIKRISNQ